MRTFQFVALFAAVSATLPALAKDEAHELSVVDQTFLREAAKGNLAETKLGELASRKAVDPAIREFGRWMASAHSLANRNVTTFTGAFHDEVVKPELDAEAKATMHKLEGLEGQAFDKAYIDAMVSDHREDLKAFEQEAAEGRDHIVKALATNMVPTIKEHLAEAEALQTSSRSNRRRADEQAGSGGMIGSADHKE